MLHVASRDEVRLIIYLCEIVIWVRLGEKTVHERPVLADGADGAPADLRSQEPRESRVDDRRVLSGVVYVSRNGLR